MNRGKIILYPLMVFLLSSNALSQSDNFPDIILFNGKIFTSSEENLYTEAIAIKGEKIIAVGKNDEIKKLLSNDTKIIDLEGRTVIPGINDAHIHCPYLLIPVWFNMKSDNPSITDILDSLKRGTREYPAGTWLSTDFPTSLIDDENFNRYTLDKIAPEHPVWLRNFTGHAILLNSAAINALDVDKKYKNINDKSVGRFPDGNLNGKFFEYSNWNLNQQLSADTPDSVIIKAVNNFSYGVLKYGITSVQTMPVIFDEFHVANLIAENDLPIRWRVMRVSPKMLNEDEINSTKGFRKNKVALSGLKYIIDGTPIERFGALSNPYSDKPDWYGFINFNENKLKRIFDISKNTGEQLLFHCIGDSSLKLVLRTMKNFADAEFWQDKRVRIEHGDGLSDNLIELAKELGVIILPNPSHFTFPEIFMQRFGKERYNKYYLQKSLLDAGLNLAFGSDGPINPYLNIMFAVTHPTHPKEAITVEQAVILYTKQTAYAEFMENEKGQLKEGMLADLAVLSQDIFIIPFDTLPKTESVFTMVGGQVVYDTGVLKVQQ
ncbi:MAG: hypothetical protein A2W30_05505 [Ignavibacteria bacterium RBG_16_36_9]|nr:MAG: hypothetical protein A2W30_05505 [Ignavibacteria bacterium RBG_16_36_9]